jgi:AraC-like DNA-binding protein
MPVEAVAIEVGYEDASFFGRLFRRKVSLTPAQYRKRFGQLRKFMQASDYKFSIVQSWESVKKSPREARGLLGASGKARKS